MASFESSFEFNYHQNNIGAYVNDIGGFSKKQTKYSIHQSFSSVYLYLWLNSNAVYLFMLFCITSVSIYKQLCTKAPCRTKLFVEFFASFIKCFRISLIFVTPARNRKKTPMFTVYWAMPCIWTSEEKKLWKLQQNKRTVSVNADCVIDFIGPKNRTAN